MGAESNNSSNDNDTNNSNSNNKCYVCIYIYMYIYVLLVTIIIMIIMIIIIIIMIIIMIVTPASAGSDGRRARRGSGRGLGVIIVIENMIMIMIIIIRRRVIRVIKIIVIIIMIRIIMGGSEPTALPQVGERFREQMQTSLFEIHALARRLNSNVAVYLHEGSPAARKRTTRREQQCADRSRHSRKVTCYAGRRLEPPKCREQTALRTPFGGRLLSGTFVVVDWFLMGSVMALKYKYGLRAMCVSLRRYDMLQMQNVSCF